MIVARCPSCGGILADKEIPYNKGIEAICVNDKLSEKEKMKKKEELLNNIGVVKICCRMRVIGMFDQAKAIL